jgi:hypothetical protein
MAKALQTTEAKARAGELVTPKGDLPTVVGGLTANLQHAIANMAPDDVVVELDVYEDATRSQAKLRFRAYRHRSTS